MKDVLEEFACVVSDSLEDVFDYYSNGITFWVTKEQFETLLQICIENKKCIQIIYDFSERKDKEEKKD